MKALIFTLMVVFTTSFVPKLDAQEQKKPNDKEIIIEVPDTIRLGAVKVSKVTDDLGKIEFKIKNSGKEALIVEKVQGCCGTKITESPTEPIRPGKTFTVKAEFTVMPRVSKIGRVISITSNATNNPKAIIQVVGEIIPDDPDLSAQ
ncbi:MAG: DUF1573 domain-containing protein [Prolixibacteraceae bacterium]|nr:DUF1573 domain-containing protein [Prolixibacteraceae bacterium]